VEIVFFHAKQLNLCFLSICRNQIEGESCCNMSNSQANDGDERVSSDSSPTTPEESQDKLSTIIGKEKADFNLLVNQAINGNS